MASLRTFIIAAAALGALFSSITARADHVSAETFGYSGVPVEELLQGGAPSSINTTQIVWGSSLTLNPISIAAGGSLTVRLTDIEWPEALARLDLLVTDLNNV